MGCVFVDAILIFMPRHSKNANTRTFNSYYEKKKNTYFNEGRSLMD